MKLMCKLNGMKRNIASLCLPADASSDLEQDCESRLGEFDRAVVKGRFQKLYILCVNIS